MSVPEEQESRGLTVCYSVFHVITDTMASVSAALSLVVASKYRNDDEIDSECKKYKTNDADALFIISIVYLILSILFIGLGVWMCCYLGLKKYVCCFFFIEPSFLPICFCF